LIIASIRLTGSRPHRVPEIGHQDGVCIGGSRAWRMIVIKKDDRDQEG
jgi:hypothetical protein